jgi:hypothetical protein
MQFRYYYTIAKLAFIVVVPTVLLILPADFFDNGEAVCLSRVLFNVECYACGLTRACMHLIHFEFEEAYTYHMMSFIIFPVLAVFWVIWFFKERKAFLKMHKALRQTQQQA